MRPRAEARVALALLILVSLACSKSTRIPPDSYAEPGGAAAYRIRTVDNHTFSAVRYSVIDSTIVVEELVSSMPRDPDAPNVPFEIQMRDVASIDRISVDRGRSSVAVLAVAGVLVTLVILFAYSLPY